MKPMLVDKNTSTIYIYDKTLSTHTNDLAAPSAATTQMFLSGALKGNT